MLPISSQQQEQCCFDNDDMTLLQQPLPNGHDEEDQDITTTNSKTSQRWLENLTIRKCFLFSCAFGICMELLAQAACQILVPRVLALEFRGGGGGGALFLHLLVLLACFSEVILGFAMIIVIVYFWQAKPKDESLQILWIYTLSGTIQGCFLVMIAKTILFAAQVHHHHDHIDLQRQLLLASGNFALCVVALRFNGWKWNDCPLQKQTTKEEEKEEEQEPPSIQVLIEEEEV